MSDKITLLIRSASQNSDESIDANLDWTVFRLKEQIEKCWTSHPIPQDQRLVYAGKLLQDSSLLRQVLRLEDLPQAFIIHLVCRHIATPPPSSPTATTTTTDGLRRRTTTSTDHATPSSSTTPIPAPANASTFFQDQASASNIDQAFVMQQMYAQYMAQYMQYLQSIGGQHYPTNGAQPWNYGMTAQAVVQDPQQPDAPNVLEPMAAAAAAATAAVAGGQAVAQRQGNLQAQEGAAPVQPGAANLVQPQPGAANLVAAGVAAAGVGPNPANVMNANAGGLGAVEEDGEGIGGQRDILDWFYVASRVLVLFSIVYFYSSFARFALVTGVSLVLYLYQIGFFGPRNPQPVQNRPQVPQPQQPQPQENNQVQQEAPPQEAVGQPDAVQTEPPAVVGPGFFNVAATFVTGFFSSLIPQDPQAV